VFVHQGLGLVALELLGFVRVALEIPSLQKSFKTPPGGTGTGCVARLPIRSALPMLAHVGDRVWLLPKCSAFRQIYGRLSR